MSKPNSFLPEDYLERKVARRTNLICVGLFLVMIAVISAAIIVQWRQVQITKTQLVEVNNTFTKRADQLRQIKELQEQQQQMIDKARVVQQLVERVPRSIILAEMINDMPRSLSLLEFELETKAKPAARSLTAMQRAKKRNKDKQDEEAGKVEIVPREVTIHLEGVAEQEKQITDFMAQLTHHPLYMDVGLSFIEKDKFEDTEVFRFGITMLLNQAVLIERSAPEQLERDLTQDPLDDNILISSEGKPKPAPPVAETPTQTD